MTTETDCPSHIEARERVAERIEARLEKARADLKHAEENRDGWFSTMPADLWQDMEDEIKLFEDLRTLLATPTQGADISSSQDHDPAIGSALEPRWPRPGDQMRFLGKNGYPHEREKALDTFEPGAVLTVKSCDVGDLSHDIVFEEAQGNWNGVMFELIEPSSAEQVAGRGPGMQNNTSATRTQEGVGREEIREAIREAFGKWNARNGNQSHCSIQFIDQLTDLFLSLLPAPKLGEDNQISHTVSDFHAPGAPEGWKPDPDATIHELKCWPAFFGPVYRREKTFEVRVNDRPYAPGDVLHLREWDPVDEAYTGRELCVGVSYLLSDERFVKPGTVIMGLAHTSSSAKPVGEGVGFKGITRDLGVDGRKMTVGKHTAGNRAHLSALIAHLDAAGQTDAADTIIWLAWWSDLHSTTMSELAGDQADLAQFNRRLREGLEQIDEVAGNPITSPGSAGHRLNMIRDMVRETLKDNGHG